MNGLESSKDVYICLHVDSDNRWFIVSRALEP